MKNKSQQGFSLPSVIVGSIIAAILSALAISSMWGSVDNSKINTIASIMKEQKVLFSSEPNYDYDTLKASGPTAEPQDYLPSLVQAGLLTPVPKVFIDEEALTWEIRKNLYQGYKVIFYASISSTNASDQELINRAVEKLGFNDSIINTTGDLGGEGG